MRNIKELYKGKRLNVFLAAPRTAWFHNAFDTKNRLREDKLFCLTRVYTRSCRRYFYAFVIGRLKILYFGKEWQ